MNNFIFKIIVDENLKNYIILPESLKIHSDLDNKTEILICFGLLKTKTNIKFHEDNYIIIAKNISKKILYQYNDLTLNVIINNNLIKLGPLLGIYVKEISHGNFGLLNTLLYSFYEHCKTHNVALLVFTPQNLNMKKNNINGYIFDELTNCWNKLILPFPDIFMDKGIFGNTPLNKSARIERNLIKYNNEIIKFNSGIGSKLDTSNSLASNPILKQHLPYTISYSSPIDIKNMLDKFKKVYLKPTNGAQGKGIIKISYIRRVFKIEKNDKKYIIKNFDEIFLQKLIDVNKKKYIVQQGIELFKSGNKIIDFRILLQKNENLVWEVTTIIARISKNEGITTNLSLGGTVKAATDIIKQISIKLNSDETMILKKIKEISILSAITLETFNGDYGELGIDLGIDSSGKMWIIEINPRPGRKSLKIISEKIRNKSIEIPILYCIKLWHQKFVGDISDG